MGPPDEPYRAHCLKIWVPIGLKNGSICLNTGLNGSKGLKKMGPYIPYYIVNLGP